MPVGEVVDMDGIGGPLYASLPWVVVTLVFVLSEKNSPSSEGVVNALEVPCDRG